MEVSKTKAITGGGIVAVVMASLPYIVPAIDTFFQQKADTDKLVAYLLCRMSALEVAVQTGKKPNDTCNLLLTVGGRK